MIRNFVRSSAAAREAAAAAAKAAEEEDVARKRFGNAKSISSAQFQDDGGASNSYEAQACSLGQEFSCAAAAECGPSCCLLLGPHSCSRHCFYHDEGSRMLHVHGIRRCDLDDRPCSVCELIYDMLEV